LAFWAHQLVEYLFALMLLAQAARTGSVLAMAAAASALALAATADGPLAAFKWVPRRVHRVLDLVVAGALVVAAVLAVAIGGQPVGGVVVTALTAAMLLVLAVRTDWSPPRPRRKLAVPQSSEDLGRAAGRMVGKGIRLAKQRQQRPRP
jgi:hypothetical protein